ncbi:MAG: hypothetical protein AAF360_18260 [Pseudomonadota bacterium]
MNNYDAEVRRVAAANTRDWRREVGSYGVNADQDQKLDLASDVFPGACYTRMGSGVYGGEKD